MKKFSKILFLILALIFTVTAFTMVALATEEEATKPEPVYRRIFNVDTDAYTKNQIYSDDPAKLGKWYVGEADNGNKYIVGAPATATGTNGNNTEQTLPGTTYGIGTYPTFALDFDVLTTTGARNWSATIRLDLYANAQKADKTGYTTSRISQMIGVRLDGDGINIAKTANVWQHVTYVVQYVGDGVFKYTFYVDGKLSNTLTRDFNTTNFSSFSGNFVSASNWNALFENNPTMNLNKIGIYTVILNPAYKSETEELWYDNIQAHYYTADYSLEDVASYVYNENYEMPYGFTEAKIGDMVYDDVNKAINAAEEGMTVKLTKNAEKELIINKNVLIDTNVYGEDGEATGSFYTYEFISTEGFAPTETAEGSGIYSFARSSNSVDVIWDEACADTCDCYAEFGGHNLSAETVAIIDYVPEYIGQTPTYEIVNGYVKEFIGWSYTKGSQTADTLLPVTADDVARGTIKLYPVYKATQYNFSATKGNNVDYYLESEFATVVNGLGSGYTVTLHTDVTFDHTILIKNNSKTLKLDLNGYKLIRHYTNITTYDAVLDEETGKYVKSGEATGTIKEGRDTTTVTTYGGGATLVYSNSIVGVNASYVDFTLTSSRPGAEIHSYVVNADRLIYNGEVVGTENISISSPLTVFGLYPAGKSTFNLDAENITVYAGTLFYAEHGSNGGSTINIDGLTYYNVGTSLGESVLGIRRGETVNVTDSDFYCNGAMLSYATYNKNTTYTFDNCNIYDFLIKASYSSNNYTFNNSNLVNAAYQYNETVILGEGTAVSKDADKYYIASGYVYAPVADKTYSYNKLVGAAAYNAENGKFVPNMSLAAATTGSFTHEVKKCSDVSESFTDVRLSMLYYTNFNMALYLPADTNATSISLGGFTQGAETVKIDGVDYYVFTRESSTAAVSDTYTTKLSYKIDGKVYRQTFKVSALVYADLILNYPMIDVETKAVANMVRYIKEARLASSLEAGTEFDSLIALGNLADLGAKEDYVDETVNFTALSGYVQSIKFMLDGTNAAYVITLTDSAIAAGVTVSVSYVDGEEITLNDSATIANAKYTSGTRVYDIAANAIEITVTVGEESFVGTYSVKAYINATNDSLTKAMYEFGVSAKAYREYLIENT